MGWGPPRKKSCRKRWKKFRGFKKIKKRYFSIFMLQVMLFIKLIKSEVFQHKAPGKILGQGSRTSLWSGKGVVPPPPGADRYTSQRSLNTLPPSEPHLCFQESCISLHHWPQQQSSQGMKGQEENDLDPAHLTTWWNGIPTPKSQSPSITNANH